MIAMTAPSAQAAAAIHAARCSRANSEAMLTSAERLAEQMQAQVEAEHFVELIERLLRMGPRDES